MKLSYKLFLAALMLFFAEAATSQSNQVVRGTIIDNITEVPIPGAKVVLLQGDTVLRALTDFDGNFRIENVALGRQKMLITYMGYKDAVFDNVQVTAGKETVLEIRMEEDIRNVQEVKVVANRTDPMNEMSVVSNRTFSVEETQKYAAAVNDPARMATSFAGVVATQGMNNDISIRGNAPRGILWRMEGMEIPNPNHFSSVGTSGGGISIISAQLLGNSDFSTGAFAAEYGNALSGVFDLSLRKGNNEKREYTIQAGMLGLDAAIEGPFKKGYGGSYLINYRYSTLGLLQYVVPIGDNVTNFQDVSFNVFLPTKKIGNFGVFGFGGLSDDKWKAVEDTVLWSTEPWRRYEGVFKANTGMVGAWHKIRIGTSGYLKTSVSVSGTNNGNTSDSLDQMYNRHLSYEESFINKRFSASTNYVHKLSAKTNFRTGITFNQLGYQLNESYREGGAMVEYINDNGNTQTGQAYFQISHKLNEKWTVNGGLHYLHLFLNNTNSLEPRASVSFNPNEKHTLGFGYGLHGQVQPIGTYFATQLDSLGNSTQPNRNLELNKAHHLVLSYKWQMNPTHLLRFETYYQYLYNVPISAANDSTFSLLNSQDGFETSTLYSDGYGRNYGVEVSLERSLKKGLYYLFAVSIFDSKYKALDGNWYNTRYNTNVSLNLTAGKDWTLKNQEKKRVVGIHVKSVYTGGMRMTPFDDASVALGNPVEDNTRSFEKSMPAYYRLDVRLSLKRDFKKVTSTVSIDLQNALNRQNVGGQYYDENKGEVAYWYQPGILPILSYRLNF